MRREELYLADIVEAADANHHGGFWRWAFAEVQDPWYAEKMIRNAVAALSPASEA
jgi:hypothetical protein